MSSQYLEYWYMALNHRFGLKLRSSNPTRLLQHLYAVRKAAMDPDLEKLSIVRPLPNQVWIVRREQEKVNAPDPQTHS